MKSKTLIRKDVWAPVFTAGSFIGSGQDMGAARVSCSRRLERGVVRTHAGACGWSQRGTKSHHLQQRGGPRGSCAECSKSDGKTDSVGPRLQVGSKDARNETEANSQIRRTNQWCADGSGVGGGCRKGRGRRATNGYSHHGDAKDSVGNSQRRRNNRVRSRAGTRLTGAVAPQIM